MNSGLAFQVRLEFKVSAGPSNSSELAHPQDTAKSIERRHNVGAGLKLQHPIFVVGTTRSGTTLLSLILGSHSAIAYAGELTWVFDFSGAEEPQNMNEYYAWLHKNRTGSFKSIGPTLTARSPSLIFPVAFCNR